jgi:hypothetical protein
LQSIVQQMLSKCSARNYRLSLILTEQYQHLLPSCQPSSKIPHQIQSTQARFSVPIRDALPPGCPSPGRIRQVSYGMRGNLEIVSPTTLELFLYRCECLKFDVTFMSTGLEVAQDQLGHSNPTTTLAIYTHALPEAQKAAVSQLAAQLFPDVPKLGPNAGK